MTKTYYLKNVTVQDLESVSSIYENLLTRKRLSKKSRLFLYNTINKIRKDIIKLSVAKPENRLYH